MIDFIFNIFIFIFVIYFFATTLALLYNAYLKKKGFAGIPDSQCFNPIKHISFIIGYTLSLIPWWIIDQYALRFYNKQCQQCIKSGVCNPIVQGAKKCGCDPHAKACSPFETCSNYYYGPIIFNKKKAILHLNSLNYKIESSYARISE